MNTHIKTKETNSVAPLTSNQYLENVEWTNKQTNKQYCSTNKQD
jgi:hypothetical protein